jgi:hypothetical protein
LELLELNRRDLDEEERKDYSRNGFKVPKEYRADIRDFVKSAYDSRCLSQAPTETKAGHRTVKHFY